MSKAFTRETDGADDEPLPIRASAGLPAGARNYLTPDGAERLRNELDRLVQVERPALAKSEEPGDKRALQRLDHRILSLEDCLRTAVVVPPPTDSDERAVVRFGAEVRVRRRQEEITYRIVGVEEAVPEDGLVSWASPIAKALINARVGEKVRFHFPSGAEELEILGIEYPA